MAKYGKCFFEEDFSAYANGPVIDEVSYEEFTKFRIAKIKRFKN